MPKSRTRRKAVSITAPRNVTSAGGITSVRSRKWLIVLSAISLLACGGGWLWWQGRNAEQVFLDHVKRGRAALSRVITQPNDGRGHVAPGERVSYRSDLPTSGAHDPTWIKPGVYDSPQSPEMLVHSLEHGLIVIYYDHPASEVLDTLKAWARLYPAAWSGVVMTPKPGLQSTIVLTAWTKVLRLQTFDPDAAAAFVDAYRGRGPENPVR